MTIGEIGNIVSGIDNDDKFWDTNYEGGSDDLNELIRIAIDKFNNHPAPYRIHITDNQGNIIFSRTKYKD